MEKCKVIELFKVSWGTVVVLDFFRPTVFNLEDELKNSSDCFWKITGIARSKLLVNVKYEDAIESMYLWDCTIESINNTEMPKIGEELSLIKR